MQNPSCIFRLSSLLGVAVFLSFSNVEGLSAQDALTATPRVATVENSSLSDGAQVPAMTAQHVDSARNNDAYSAWNALLRDVMQLGMRAGAQNAMPQNGGGLSGNNVSAAAPMQPGNGANGFRGGPHGNATNLGSLFQLAGDASRGFTSNGHNTLATTFGALPALNQLLRGGLSLPMNSSIGSFRLSYQSPFSLANSLQMNGMNGYGSGTASYYSPHARSGRIDFSASAMMGMGSGSGMGGYGGNGGNMGGMQQAGAGGHGPGGHGPGGNSAEPSASVSLHLSF